MVAHIEPRPAPPRWMYTTDFARPPYFGRMRNLAERLHNEHGDSLGYLYLYAPDTPLTLTNLLVRGDRAALALKPVDLAYRTIADLPAASEKAIRDAGTIAVTNVAINGAGAG